MSKSLDFCVKRASDPKHSSYNDRDWSKASEKESEPFFNQVIKQAREIVFENKDKKELRAKLVFDENAEFEYFTSWSAVHDGTLVFLFEGLSKVANKVLMAETYDTRIGPHKYGDTIRYTIGNFVILDEFGEWEGHPKWMQSRTTILLPLKYEILERK